MFLGAAGFRVFFRLLFFFERTRPASSMRPSCLIYLSTSNKAITRERSDRVFFWPIGKKDSSYRGAHRVPFFNYIAALILEFEMLRH